MPQRGLDDRLTFLSHAPARAANRRLAIIVATASAIAFAIVAPYAQVRKPTVWAFIPRIKAALATNDLITAVLLRLHPERHRLHDGRLDAGVLFLNQPPIARPISPARYAWRSTDAPHKQG